MNNNFPRMDDRSLTQEIILKKITELYEKESFKILETDFKDLYGNENVNKDLQRAIELKKIFDREATQESKISKKLATALEHLITEQTELNDWLGENVVTYETSVTDDWINGVDTVVETIIDSDILSTSYFGMTFDITYANDLSKKLNRIKREIEAGTLSKVKYFMSETTNIRGEISQIPRVIIGADISSMYELFELRLKKDNKALAKHFFQYQMLDEIEYQLNMFKEYAESVGKEDIAKKYLNLLNIVKGIKRDKGTGDDTRDNFFDNLKASVSSTFLV